MNFTPQVKYKAMKFALKWFFITLLAVFSLAVAFSPLAEKKSRGLSSVGSFSADVWRAFNNMAFTDSEEDSSAAAPKQTNSSKEKFITKRDLLGKDYDAPIPSNVITSEVNAHLNSIENLCAVKDLSRQAGLLQISLDDIQSSADKYIGRLGLQMDDALLLRDVRYMLHRDQISFGRPITANLLRAEDIRLSFELTYRLHHALPEGDPIEQHLEDWAKKIYKGLDCVYSNL